MLRKYRNVGQYVRFHWKKYWAWRLSVARRWSQKRVIAGGVVGMALTQESVAFTVCNPVLRYGISLRSLNGLVWFCFYRRAGIGIIWCGHFSSCIFHSQHSHSVIFFTNCTGNADNYHQVQRHGFLLATCQIFYVTIRSTKCFFHGNRNTVSHSSWILIKSLLLRGMINHVKNYDFNAQSALSWSSVTDTWFSLFSVFSSPTESIIENSFGHLPTSSSFRNVSSADIILLIQSKINRNVSFLPKRLAVVQPCTVRWLDLSILRQQQAS